MAEKIKVLFVDDDTNLLSAAKRLLRKEIDLYIAASGEEALHSLEKNGPFSVLVSDQNMPSMKGVTLLGEASKRWPSTVRIMLTGNDDQETAISAVNDGHVYRFVRKPCQPANLLAAIKEGAQHHALLMREKTLLEQTLSGSVKVLTDMLSLAKPDAFKKTARVQKWAKALAPHLDTAAGWETNLATMLYPIGAITLPDSLAARHYAGDALGHEEQRLIEAMPEAARDLIHNIPRLDGVAKAVYYSRKAYDGSGFPLDDVKGDDLPAVSRLLKILIDLVDLTKDHNKDLEEAFAQMDEQSHLYDNGILQITRRILLSQDEYDGPKIQVFEHLAAAHLHEGDMIMKPIKDKQGRVLLASGAELSSILIKRLKAMQEAGLIEEEVHISRWKNAS
ncbi:MAG: response regulator [Cohaesibacter sp.]|nr:response regulator [Cohaesibacter sp.]